jgi:hypothetical protein
VKLTLIEDIAKDWMFNLFIPALHTLVSQNVEKYKQWGGNTCRQSAVFGAYFLNRILPEYEWSVWDGDFNDVIKGVPVSYNHAWIFGVDRSNGRRLLVDLSRVLQERLFIVVKSNAYPKNLKDYKNMKEIRRERLNWVQMINEDCEYFTKLSGKEFIERLDTLILSKISQDGIANY